MWLPGATREKDLLMPPIDQLTFEERKLAYLNLTARVMDKKERDEIDAKYADVLAVMTGSVDLSAAKAAPPKAGTKAQVSLANFITDHGALVIAIACLPALNDQEFQELALAAEKVYSERNPGRTLGEVEKATKDALTGVGGEAEPTIFVAEEGGAYIQPDGVIVKFAAGDTITEDAKHFITVQSYIPDGWGELKAQQAVALAKKLGADATVKTRDDALAYVGLQVEARDAEIAAIPDPETETE